MNSIVRILLFWALILWLGLPTHAQKAKDLKIDFIVGTNVPQISAAGSFYIPNDQLSDRITCIDYTVNGTNVFINCLAFSIPVTDIKTPMKQLTKDILKFIFQKPDGTYPNIAFEFSKVNIDLSKEKSNISGNLTFKDISHPINLTLNILENDNDYIKVHSEFGLDTAKYDVKPVERFRVKVNQIATINVQLAVEK